MTYRADLTTAAQELADMILAERQRQRELDDQLAKQLDELTDPTLLDQQLAELAQTADRLLLDLPPPTTTASGYLPPLDDGERWRVDLRAAARKLEQTADLLERTPWFDDLAADCRQHAQHVRAAATATMARAAELTPEPDRE